MNKNNDLIRQKLDELIAIAQEQKDVNVAIVLLTLQGAKLGGLDGVLADTVQKLINEVLIPFTLSEIESHKISLN